MPNDTNWKRNWSKISESQKKGRCFSLKPIKLPDFLTKAGKTLLQYRYAMLILLLGLVFLMVPERTEQPEQPESVQAETQSLETRLEDVLSRVEGAGAVRMILTVRESEELIYQTDADTEASGDSSIKTVLTDQGSTEEPIPVKTIGPVYEGALVVAEGGDRASVRLDLIQAVAGLTGLGTDKITVMKMKTE